MTRSICLPSTFPVTAHTSTIGIGSTFVAIKGTNHDGVYFIPEALEKGASTIVLAHDAHIPERIQELLERYQVTVRRVENTRKTLAELSAQAAHQSSSGLCIIGITGTKGKTTTVHITAHMLRTQGFKVAVISSIKNSIDSIDFPPQLTTPQPDYLHQFFSTCIAHNITHVVMEVAAQALTLYRVHGILFDAVAFTNFDLEHLEFYSTMDEYFSAKAQLINQKKVHAPAFVHADNVWTKQLLSIDNQVYGISLQRHAGCVTYTVIHQTREKSYFIVDDKEYMLPMFGTYNVENAVFAMQLAQAVGVSSSVLQTALATLPSISGRGERYVLSNGAIGIIDFAHNPMSFRALLSTLREQTSHLIVIFGAGGERDAQRRPLMGAIAAQYADIVILTDDNPRREDPVKIMHDILQGISPNAQAHIHVEHDRMRAIHYAYQVSCRDSIIALLGKGSDEYQLIGTTKIPFSERAILCAL